ncbi:phosphatidylinositol-specific phospholipase C/glycerophosphodiester phosphodiesterase family protein [Bacillus sp. FJAT-29937]|uniref:phosphatidylinositol-specific phospholipase C/glycerophosphodiester phosphodiesterase family protein n=1 Tax=Bacillus sp. FJAT-29937 TaxID=1720553 RepID=UPI00082A79D4|nr:phosphatidylinositol-specific phospholipase C/glycerophosphodiester phosphodiesterase family protein [Bacillus sp. FJAT-29937]
MKKLFFYLLVSIPLILLVSINDAYASTKIMWGKTELKIGQIGKVTILENTSFYKINSIGELESVNRIAKKGNEFRVYNYKSTSGGIYGLGAELYVKKTNQIKYETPSKAKLALLKGLDEKKSDDDNELINKNQNVWINNKLIAHAMGGINGKTYSNSLEAFEHNYNLGYRIFEVDFSLTSDDILVARHDWRVSLSEMYQQDSPTTIDEPWTYDYFINQKIYKKYTPLDVDKVIELMQTHKDMYIVTDTKETQSDIVKHQFQLIVDAAKNEPEILNRVIPQIYNQNMLSVVKSTYNFPNLIYTLYMSKDTDQQVIDFALKNGIKAITMSTYRFNEKFVNNLNNVGIVSYVHTINDKETINKFLMYGIHGFYSDFALPSENI